MIGREGRESERIQGVFRVTFPSLERFVIAYSHNLSKGGMFLATNEYLPINAVIRLEIELPEGGGRISVTCRVVYVRDRASSDASGKVAGMGVQFLDLDQDGLTHLARFVADRSMASTQEDTSEGGKDRPLDLLIVDDDRTSSERAAAPFRERGDTVRTASDGLHALAACLKQPPDAIVSDVQMPRMDGWQLVRIVRSRPSLSSIPFLFLTQLWGEDERLKGYKMGVDDFIAKPFRPEELVIRVRRAVQKSQRHGSNLAQQKTLRGDLEQVSLASVLAFLELEKKTGVLLLVGPESARIYVQAGRPLKIELGDEAGLGQRAAMDRVLDWRHGQFEFATQDIACVDELRASVTSILLEHARVQDEKQR